MTSVSENTLEVDFSTCKNKRPSVPVILTWLKQIAKLPVEFIEGIQVNKNIVYVTFKNKNILHKNITGIFPFKDNLNNNYNIPIRNLTNITLVKILNIPFDIPMIQISKLLSKYGKVISCEFEIWNENIPIKNGIRICKMILDIPIPEYLEYDNDKNLAEIKYDGKKTCELCNSNKHFIHNCPWKRDSNKQYENNVNTIVTNKVNNNDNVIILEHNRAINDVVEHDDIVIEIVDPIVPDDNIYMNKILSGFRNTGRSESLRLRRANNHVRFNSTDSLLGSTRSLNEIDNSQLQLDKIPRIIRHENVSR
jgi:hypothetical protein